MVRGPGGGQVARSERTLQHRALETLAVAEARLARRSQRAALALWSVWGVGFDLRHDVATTRRVPGAGGEPRDAFVPWFVPLVLPPASVAPGEVFLDVGSGKGRQVLYAASRYRFARVVGVELAGDLHRAAEANLRRWRGRRAPVELVHSDVLEWPIPDDVTVVFAYNPFGSPVFERFLARLTASLERAPRRLRLLYANPQLHRRVLEAGFAERAHLGRIRLYEYPSV